MVHQQGDQALVGATVKRGELFGIPDGRVRAQVKQESHKTRHVPETSQVEGCVALTPDVIHKDTELGSVDIIALFVEVGENHASEFLAALDEGKLESVQIRG